MLLQSFNGNYCEAFLRDLGVLEPLHICKYVCPPLAHFLDTFEREGAALRLRRCRLHRSRWGPAGSDAAEPRVQRGRGDQRLLGRPDRAASHPTS